ncbi:MAG: FkbM family methyltransferase [Nanoarchaeota archaeon]
MINLPNENYDVSVDHESDIKEFAESLPRGLPIIELGGGLGIVSCYINNLLKPISHKIVEANPALITQIMKRRDENKCSFEVLNYALSYTAPKIMFNIDMSPVASSEKRSGSQTITKRIEIPTIRLRDLVNEKVIVFCDIEGNEIDLIDSDIKVLKKKVTYFIVEFHERISGRWQIKKSLLKLWLNGFRVLEKYNKGKTCPSYLLFNKTLVKVSRRTENNNL